MAAHARAHLVLGGQDGVARVAEVRHHLVDVHRDTLRAPPAEFAPLAKIDGLLIVVGGSNREDCPREDSSIISQILLSSQFASRPSRFDVLAYFVTQSALALYCLYKLHVLHTTRLRLKVFLD